MYSAWVSSLTYSLMLISLVNLKFSCKSEMRAIGLVLPIGLRHVFKIFFFPSECICIISPL